MAGVENHVTHSPTEVGRSGPQCRANGLLAPDFVQVDPLVDSVDKSRHRIGSYVDLVSPELLGSYHLVDGLEKNGFCNQPAAVLRVDCRHVLAHAQHKLAEVLLCPP